MKTTFAHHANSRPIADGFWKATYRHDSRPMGVGIYTSSYPGLTGPGGIGTYTRHLAHALSELGHRVHVLTRGPSPSVVGDGHVTVHVIQTHVPLLDRIMPGSAGCYTIGAAMRKLVSRCNLDIVEFPNYEGLAVWFSVGRTVPLVVRLHTSSLENLEISGGRPTRFDCWDIRREKWMSKTADRLVTHSSAHRQRMAHELAIRAESILLVPHGVPVRPDFVRPANGENELTIVYLGRLEKRKGTLDLLRAIPLVLRECDKVRFVLIGWDRPDCPGGRTHAQFILDELPLDCQKRIHLMGMLPDDEVDHWLQRADVFVAPSLYESFGLGFLEAMRWGTPVIGTNVGGIPEVVEHGMTGLLVSPESPSQLAQALLTLLQNADVRCKLGQEARRCVESRFSSRRMAEQVSELYANTVASWHAKRRTAGRVPERTAKRYTVSWRI